MSDEKEIKDFVISVCVYFPERLKRFIEYFYKFDPGCNYDIYFIHNKWERNLEKERIQKIDSILSNLISFHPEINIIERPNYGWDVGAHQFAYQLFKNMEYRYYFFINEIAIIKQDNWLLKFKEIYEKYPNVGASGPQICYGISGEPHHNDEWTIRTTFFSLRASIKNKFVWPAPNSETQAKDQEMTLFYGQLKNMNMNIYQVGNGFELMNYIYDNGKEWTYASKEGIY